MIRVNGAVVTPTIFPDKTSQVWKLPQEVIDAKHFAIEWRFEEEREIIDLAGITALLAESSTSMELYMPYLPYARQDKLISNDATFNLAAFGLLINSMGFDKVSALDVHNPHRCEQVIHNFKNLSVKGIHFKLCEKILPDFFVFPDAGAHQRYQHFWDKESVIFDKVRDQSTGEIIGLETEKINHIMGANSVLIIDDICDGGRTFIEVAKALRSREPLLIIHLFVTHGIFSKGKDHLLKNGIDFIHTTNSLKQVTQMEIFPV